MSETMNITVSKLLEYGCEKAIVDQLLLDIPKAELIHVLKKYKHELKNTIDADGKSIDCIDYLIYNLEKK